MTFREKLKMEYPEKVVPGAVGGCIDCPHTYGYAAIETAYCLTRGDREVKFASANAECTACWSREIPEEKVEALKYEPYEPKRGLRAASPVIIDELHETKNVEEVDDHNSIKDSGDRTEFETGAVRDMREGKGRCDLMPLDVIGYILDSPTICYIANFKNSNDKADLINALTSSGVFHDPYTMFLEVAKHFEDGAKKYGEYNWQKGIPVNCYIDSAVRHYLKYLRGDKDEPHDRAFVWNILCCIWTCEHKPELNNYKKTNN